MSGLQWVSAYSLNPSSTPHHEGVAEGEREGGVETAEVNFVPLEGDLGVSNDDVVVLNEGDAVGVEKLEGEKNDDVEWDGGDMRMMGYVSEDLEKYGEGDEEKILWNQRLTVAKFWRTQVDTYEARIVKLEKKVHFVSDGFKAAKRVAEEETAEVEQLRKLYMDKISEAERLTETVADLEGQNCDLEMRDQVRRQNNKRRVQELKKELEDERRRSMNLEEEVSATRKRLLTFTRQLVPCKARRLI